MSHTVSVALRSRVERIFEEYCRVTNFTPAEIKRDSKPRHDGLERFYFQDRNGIWITFIYGTGRHAHDLDCLDVLYDTQYGTVGEESYTWQLWGLLAEEVATDIANNVLWQNSEHPAEEDAAFAFGM